MRLLKELLENKKDDARRMIKPMIAQGSYSQDQILKKMEAALGIKPSTSDTYYHMIAKEVNNMDDDAKQKLVKDAKKATKPTKAETPDSVMLADIKFDDVGNVVSGEEYFKDDQYAVQNNVNRRGVVRKVDGAHLVYKRMNDNGTFDELWLFNISDTIRSAIDIKRSILAGTDIPIRQTTSTDGVQRYSMTTLGNAQYLEINNLPQ